MDLGMKEYTLMIGVYMLNVLFFSYIPFYLEGILKAIGLHEYGTYFISQIIVPPLYLFVIICLSMVCTRKLFSAAV